MAEADSVQICDTSLFCIAESPSLRINSPPLLLILLDPPTPLHHGSSGSAEFGPARPRIPSSHVGQCYQAGPRSQSSTTVVPRSVSYSDTPSCGRQLINKDFPPSDEFRDLLDSNAFSWANGEWRPDLSIVRGKLWVTQPSLRKEFLRALPVLW